MSLNDPQWGRGGGSGGNGKDDADPRESKDDRDDRDEREPRGPDHRPRRSSGQDGPPDLDELWRDFNKRLNGLFGKATGGRGDGGGRGEGGGGMFGRGGGIYSLVARRGVPIDPV